MTFFFVIVQDYIDIKDIRLSQTLVYQVLDCYNGCIDELM